LDIVFGSGAPVQSKPPVQQPVRTVINVNNGEEKKNYDANEFASAVNDPKMKMD
jgi:hypothetical protein